MKKLLGIITLLCFFLALGQESFAQKRPPVRKTPAVKKDLNKQVQTTQKAKTNPYQSTSQVKKDQAAKANPYQSTSQVKKEQAAKNNPYNKSTTPSGAIQRPSKEGPQPMKPAPAPKAFVPPSSNQAKKSTQGDGYGPPPKAPTNPYGKLDKLPANAPNTKISPASTGTNPYGALPKKPAGAPDNNLTPPKKTAYGDTKLTDKPKTQNGDGTYMKPPAPNQPTMSKTPAVKKDLDKQVKDAKNAGDGTYMKPPPPQRPTINKTPAVKKDLDKKAANAKNAADNGGYMKPPPPPKKSGDNK